MKKLLSILIFLIVIQLNIYSLTEELSKDPVFVNWTFEPEVGTKIGFNIDNSKVGFLGNAKLDLKSEIFSKKDHAFQGKGDMYGYVRIKDFEIKIFIDDKVSDFDSSAEGVESPLLVKWGSVEGKIFLGPVYIVLKNVGQDEVTFIETLDDEDLDFSTIGYSVIPAYFTGSYDGVETPYRTSTNDSATGNIVDNALGLDKRNLGAFSIGFILPEVLTLEFGSSLGYSYKEHIPVDYNPYALSLFADVTALGKVVENLSLKTKITVQGGRNSKDLLDEDNPITFGFIVGYSVPLGEYKITPKLATEMQFYSLKRYQDPTYTGTIRTEAEKNVYVPFEIALGANLDWLSKGGTHASEEKASHLSFSNRDIKVQDGISLGMIYGQAPHTDYRDINVPYLGFKIALWESEGKDKPGYLNALKLGAIINMNYAVGGTADLKNSLDIRETKRSLTYDGRFDFGLGLEASYKILFLEPFFGLLVKAFNVTNGKVEREVVSNGVSSKTSYDNYINQTDVRMKIGVDITEIIGNTTLTGEWVSGDLVNDNAVTGGPDYTEYDYFENNTSSTNNSVMNTNTLAKFGYIAIGAKIKF